MKKFLLMLGLLILFMVGPILTTLARGEGDKKFTNISIHNTYSIGVELEVKCLGLKSEGYAFYKRFFIPKKSNRILSVPQGLTNCEVWVTDIKLW